MLKVIELAKRKPGMPVDEFQRHWRERHAPLVAACTEVHRHVVSCALPQGYLKGDLLFDGISEIWFESAADYYAYRRSPAAAVIAADQANFLDLSRALSMPVEVHIIKDAAISQDAVKNIELLDRKPGTSPAAFCAHWRDVHGPIASGIAAIQRYEQNHPLPGAYPQGAAPPFDGIAVAWFASTVEMKSAATTPEYAATRKDEPNFLASGRHPIIITREQQIFC